MDENNENEVAINVAALGEKFEEKNYFRRLLDMFKGLKKPKNTAEYKLARLELQRQQAAQLERENHDLAKNIAEIGTVQGIKRIASQMLDLVEDGASFFTPGATNP